MYGGLVCGVCEVEWKIVWGGLIVYFECMLLYDIGESLLRMFEFRNFGFFF